MTNGSGGKWVSAHPGGGQAASGSGSGSGQPASATLANSRQTLPASPACSPTATCPLQMHEVATPSISGVTQLRRRRWDIPSCTAGAVVFKAERAQDNLGYKGYARGMIAPAKGGGDLFFDHECKHPLNQPLELPFAQFEKGVTLYARPADRDGKTIDVSLLLSRPRDARITVAGPATHSILINDVVRVNPVIKLEYKVAMLDRQLYTLQRAGEPRFEPHPTRIELSLDNPDPRYVGKGLLTLPGNVNAFKDPTCSTPAPLREFTADELRAGVKLWLRGGSVGQFDLQLALSPSNHPMVEAGPPVKEKMGVARLELALFQYDDAATKPAKRPHDNAGLVQVEMTAADRITGKRLMTVQRSSGGTNHASRAKLLVKKLDAGHWPAGSESHVVVIDGFGRTGAPGTAGQVKLFDAETDGNELALPFQIKVADLQAAEKTYWVEGADICRDWGDAGLDLGIDRTDPPPIAKVAKRWADFARFTVIRVARVEILANSRLEETAPKSGKFNLWTNQKKGATGRDIEVKALIEPELDGVKLYFRWVADKDNRKTNNGVDLTEVWPRIDPTWTKAKAINLEWFDTPSRGADKHRHAVTTQGVSVPCKLAVSRYGGDKAKIGVYITQDPQQGQFKRSDASHKQEPAQFLEVEVRRKFWIQPILEAGSSLPSTALAVDVMRRVRAKMIAKPKIELSSAELDAIPNARYPGYMIVHNGGNAKKTVISNLNKHLFYSKFKPAALTLPIAICDTQWDYYGAPQRVTLALNNLKATDFPKRKNSGFCMCSPALNGSPMFISGTYTLYEWDPVAAAWSAPTTGALNASHVRIDPNRPSVQHITVLDPTAVGGVSAMGPNHRIHVSVTLQGADGEYAGESFQKRILIIRQPDQQYNDTIVHECGHAFRMAINPGNQLPEGPIHPDSRLGQGWHCFHHEVGSALNCVMDPVVQTDAAGIHRFCEACHGFMLIEEMSDIQ